MKCSCPNCKDPDIWELNKIADTLAESANLFSEFNQICGHTQVVAQMMIILDYIEDLPGYYGPDSSHPAPEAIFTLEDLITTAKAKIEEIKAKQATLLN